jgi:hypothetical protein
MADYDIEFYCEQCHRTHPLGVKIPIKGGPPVKRSVGAFYAGKKPLSKIADLIDSQALCPKTGKMFTQKNVHQIFLAPVK